MKHFIYREAQLWSDFGVLTGLGSNSSKFVVSSLCVCVCVYVCVCVQVTSSVKYNFVIHKVSKIIIFLKRLIRVKLDCMYRMLGVILGT